MAYVIPRDVTKGNASISGATVVCRAIKWLHDAYNATSSYTSTTIMAGKTFDASKSLKHPLTLGV